MIMFPLRSVLMLAIFLFPHTFIQPKEKKLYFIDNDSLEILNGKVKHIEDAPVDNEYSTNPGQDYSIADLNEKGEITKTVDGFHGSIFKTYYVTRYDSHDRKLETLGYFRPSDGTGEPTNLLFKPNQSDKDTTKRLLFIYRYNEKGEIVNQVVSPGKPNADSSAYKYNDQGNVIELDHYAYNKTLMDVTNYTYDEKGNLVEEEKFHWKHLMAKTSLEYQQFDSNNNWIDLINHSEYFLGIDQKETVEMRRKITYY